MATRGTRLAVLVVGVGLLVVGVGVRSVQADEAFAVIVGVMQGPILGDQVDVRITGSRDAIQITDTGFNLGSPGGTGVPKAGPVILRKRLDRASPKLLRAAFTGERLTVDIIWYMNVSGVNRQTVTIRLEEALISAINTTTTLAATNGANATESVQLHYSRLTLTVPVVDSFGRVVGVSSVCLDAANARTC